MTAVKDRRPGLGNRPRADTIQLIATAHRGGIVRENRRPWAVYLINGQVNPGARVVVRNLIDDGWLYDTDPGAEQSSIDPTPAGLAKIGATA